MFRKMKFTDDVSAEFFFPTVNDAVVCSKWKIVGMKNMRDAILPSLTEKDEIAAATSTPASRRGGVKSRNSVLGGAVNSRSGSTRSGRKSRSSVAGGGDGKTDDEAKQPR
jgi:hypothetical protein